MTALTLVSECHYGAWHSAGVQLASGEGKNFVSPSMLQGHCCLFGHLRAEHFERPSQHWP